MRNLLIMAFCLALIGCAHSAPMVKKSLVQPQYGMAKEQMITLMGMPDSMEIYQKSDKTKVEFYIYIKKYPSSEFKLPVCLINNKVVGWGKTYYEDHATQEDLVRIK